MVGSRGRRSAWAVPALLFLGVLFVAGLAFNLANLDPGQETVPDVPDAGGTPPQSTSLVDLPVVLYALTVSAGVLFIVLGTMLVARRRAKKRPAIRIVRRSQLVQTLVMLVLFLVIVALWRGTGPGDDDGEGDNATQGSDGNPGFGIPALPRIAGVSPAAFLAAALFVALLASAFLVRGTRAFGRPPPSSGLHPGPREAVSETLGETIRRIELGEDVRSAILACFARFCELLGARGVSNQATMTPREIEDLAVTRLRVSGRDAEDLTGLFEEARYSVHLLGEPDRARALRSLARIRTVLET